MDDLRWESESGGGRLGVGSLDQKRIIVIVGPTCSGKTNLSLKLSQLIATEIISADSRQIYKYLNIGTAKPSEHQLEIVPHHLIDILDPSENYDVSLFEKDAEQIIEGIFKKDKIPIVVGGSGLYIKALIDGIFDSSENDEEYRKELLQKRKEFGNEFLYEELKKVDPVSAEKMLPQNWKRVIRALEIFRTTGEPIWKHHQKQSSSKEKNYTFKQFGLNWERALLYENINRRVDWMIEYGLIDEVKNILEMGYDKNLNSLNTVGYKEIIQHLKGEISLERAIELIKRNTRHYAKRQNTWFRKDERIHWFDVKVLADLNCIAEEILRGIKV
ncbi:MAG TPA: tRNA (adenosine(37)-N6)-dimethylallyltransferase MiaA [Ignavibacteriaceae bacterium]|nr:tRNA (adenosine(37)-N6)-dimethylallyltransferase MiaA [Ignavibacteriaceae bacterium]